METYSLGSGPRRAAGFFSQPSGFTGDHLMRGNPSVTGETEWAVTLLMGASLRHDCQPLATHSTIGAVLGPPEGAQTLCKPGTHTWWLAGFLCLRPHTADEQLLNPPPCRGPALFVLCIPALPSFPIPALRHRGPDLMGDLRPWAAPLDMGHQPPPHRHCGPPSPLSLCC